MSGEEAQACWVVVVESDNEVTDRLGVPGGWIYRSTQWLESEDEHGHAITSERTESMVFVPDVPK